MEQNIDLSRLTLIGVEAALTAGQLLRKGFGTKFEIKSKEIKQNLVTEYDHAAEKIIVDLIHHHFPDHAILAEESGSTGLESSKVCWIIDPLDGTVNFAHNIPIFAVSIGLCVNGIIESGIIYQPINDELFIAQKGKGSFMNRNPLKVTEVQHVEDAVITSGLPYHTDDRHKQCLDDLIKIALLGCPVRYLGSAAIQLAYIAAGRCDAYFGISLEPWDIAAGKLIVEEAGGKVTRYDGQAIDPYKNTSILATNGLIHQELLDYLARLV